MAVETFYRLDAKFERIAAVGAVAEGVRMDSYFAGRLSGGPLDGATLTGVDYFRIRPDGVGVVDGHELVELDGARVAVKLSGYVLPPAGAPIPPAEVLTAADFTWPDLPFSIEAFATFQTGAPEFAELNRTVVAHTGTANLGTGELTVVAHRLSSLGRVHSLA
nr:DUF3237 family protein [Micromonospora sp. DSM 115978]